MYIKFHLTESFSPFLAMGGCCVWSPGAPPEEGVARGGAGVVGVVRRGRDGVVGVAGVGGP